MIFWRLERAELQSRAKELGVDLAGVDQRVNPDLRRAIWESGPDISPQDTEIDLGLSKSPNLECMSEFCGNLQTIAA